MGLATEEVNDRQPENVFKHIINNFPNTRLVGIAGVTYKPNSKVIDDSQSLLIAKLLVRNGIEVKLYDPLLNGSDLPEFTVCNSVLDLTSAELVIVSQEFEYLLDGIKNKIENLLVI